MSGGPMSDLQALNKWLGEQPKPKTTTAELHDKDMAEILVIPHSHHHVDSPDCPCTECWEERMNDPEGVMIMELKPDQQSVENVYNALKSIFGE